MDGLPFSRESIFDTGPRDCVCPESIAAFFLKNGNPPGRIKVAGNSLHSIPSTAKWNELHPHNAPKVWLRSQNTIFHCDIKPWHAMTRAMYRMSNFEFWCRAVDGDVTKNRSDPVARDTGVERRIAKARELMREGDMVDFIDPLAEAMHEHDVVLVSMPPGYGKSTFAAAVVRKMWAAQQTALEAEGGAMRRGAIDRLPGDMDKILQLQPSASNAAATTKYIWSISEYCTNVAGYIHPLLDVNGACNPRISAVDHVILPYREAEYAIENGRFNTLILDEYHLDDISIASCLLAALRTMAGPAETVLRFVNDQTDTAPFRRRISKVLILMGVRSPDLEEEIRRMVESQSEKFGEGRKSISFKSLIFPQSQQEWEHRRHPIKCSVFHGDSSVPQDWHTDLSRNVALTYRHTDAQLLQEESLFSNPLAKLPSFVHERLAVAARCLMHRFRAEAVDTLLRDAHASYEFPSIIVFVPSTGCATQVKKALRFAAENKMTIPNESRDHYIQPYRIECCSRTVDEEKALTQSWSGLVPKWKSNFDASSEVDRRYKSTRNQQLTKGLVAIVVNGAEAGLTIHNVGGVVESGVERLRNHYDRNGLSSFKFVLSDKELTDQRAGRGGRTCPSQLITCLTNSGCGALINAQSSVVVQKRKAALSRPDFMRMIVQGNLWNHPLYDAACCVEMTTEGRINGTLWENNVPKPEAETGIQSMEVRATPLATQCQYNLRNVSPELALSLRAFLAAEMALHGLVAVALKMTGKTALAKPSESNRSAVLGPSARLNALDIYMTGVISYSHNCSGEERALRKHTGDFLALVEAHVQLIIASGYDLVGPVPSKDEMLRRTAGVDGKNFWLGNWLPCGKMRVNEELVLRMDNKSQNEPGGMAFVYGRLVTDEERKELWSTLRLLLLDLVMAMEIPFEAYIFDEKMNQYVRNLKEDPILIEDGRAVFNMIEVICSTRFARIDYSEYLEKTRGHFYDYFEEKGDGREITRLRKNVRAEAMWDKHVLHNWFKFEPTSTSIEGKKRAVRAARSGSQSSAARTASQTSTASSGSGNRDTVKRDGGQAGEEGEEEDAGQFKYGEPVEETWVALCDPVTDLQLAFFGNVFGRWRIVADKVDETTAYTLEIETNTSCAIFGLKLKMEKDKMELILAVRRFIHDYLPQTHHRVDERGDFKAALSNLIAIWREAGPINTTSYYNDYEYFP